MKYGQFDNDGLPIAFFDGAINTIPVDAVKLTNEQWHELISNQGLRKWAGGNVIEYIPPTPTDEELMVCIRSVRDALLAGCDWTQVIDAPVNQLEWAAYRQLLRDFPETCDPQNIVWPEVPNA